MSRSCGMHSSLRRADGQRNAQSSLSALKGQCGVHHSATVLDIHWKRHLDRHCSLLVLQLIQLFHTVRQVRNGNSFRTKLDLFLTPLSLLGSPLEALRCSSQVCKLMTCWHPNCTMTLQPRNQFTPVDPFWDPEHQHKSDQNQL